MMACLWLSIHLMLSTGALEAFSHLSHPHATIPCVHMIPLPLAEGNLRLVSAVNLRGAKGQVDIHRYTTLRDTMYTYRTADYMMNYI